MSIIEAPTMHREDTAHMLTAEAVETHDINEANKYKDSLEDPNMGDQDAFDTSSKRKDARAYPEFSMTRESLSEAQGEHYAKAQATAEIKSAREAVEAAVPKPEVTIAAKTAGEIVAQQTVEQ